MGELWSKGSFAQTMSKEEFLEDIYAFENPDV